MSKAVRLAKIFTFSVLGAALGLPACSPASAQDGPALVPVAVTPNLLRAEGTDAESGIHYVRLSLLTGKGTKAPRVTMECRELNGKRDILWFVNFGGADDTGFLRPFHKTPTHRTAPRYPTVKLTTSFEGWRPMTRAWALLPSGELLYRNPGMKSPNMESPRWYLAYLNTLPGLEIGYASPEKSDPAEVDFETRPLLDEISKTPTCRR